MTDDDTLDPEADELFAPPGPRRATYTPPPHNATTLRNAASVFSDAEIAAALAEQLASTRASLTAAAEPAPIAHSSPETSPEDAPHPHSLSDDELVHSIEAKEATTGGTLSAIEQLESQLRLRERKAHGPHEGEGSALPSMETAAAAETPAVAVEDAPPEAAPSEFDAVLAGTSTAEHPHVPEHSTAVEPPHSAHQTDPGQPDALRHTGELDFDSILAGDAEEHLHPAEGTLPAWHIQPAQPGIAPSEPSTDTVAAELDASRVDLREADKRDLFGPDARGASTAENLAALRPTTRPAEVAAAASAPVRPADRPAIADPHRQRVFVPEEAGEEPAPREQRVGRAVRLFWLWFAANSSLVTVGLGATVFALGMSLRQSIVAILAGVALSFLPLGFGTLAGKRSGQPTMVVSRATFGLIGNILPALIALISRIFWGAALLWIAGAATAGILLRAGLAGSFSGPQVTLMAMALGFLFALLIAFFGYALLARVQLVLSIVSLLLIAGFVALTAGRLDFRAALTTADGDWTLGVTGAVIVFSFIGLVWANSGGDLARYQRPTASGGGSMLVATFGTALPSFLLIAYGALLAASDPEIAGELVTHPLDALGGLLPSWYPIPLVAATALSLISGVAVSIYSGAFALQATRLAVSRPFAVVFVGVGLALISAVLASTVSDFGALFRDFATTLAVPIAAWTGLFAMEMMIRNRRFDATSLLRRGGVYADVRWVNLLMLIVASALGYGFTSTAVDWLSWQGYLFPLVGVPLDSMLAATDVGVLVALLIGLSTPLVAGIPAIRRQESAKR